MDAFWCDCDTQRIRRDHDALAFWRPGNVCSWPILSVAGVDPLRKLGVRQRQGTKMAQARPHRPVARTAACSGEAAVLWLGAECQYVPGVSLFVYRSFVTPDIFGVCTCTISDDARFDLMLIFF